MFGLSDMIEIYLAEKEQLSKDGKLTPTQLKTIWRVPIKLKIAITELEPKLDKLAKLRENQYGLIKDITDIHNNIIKTLGLVHHNFYIDQTTYDDFGNMVSGRVRIYSDSASVGTNTNIIETYLITADATECGQFNYWTQVKI